MSADSHPRISSRNVAPNCAFATVNGMRAGAFQQPWKELIMSRILQLSAAIAATLAIGACSNLTAYPNSQGPYYAPGTSTMPGASAERATRTPDKIEGNSGPAVKGPTGD